ncbi:MAG: KilA-N domain-containing protein [Clostridia bacterium]|nr:KilA-N domain-containing protein [Clostridia bacterium]
MSLEMYEAAIAEYLDRVERTTRELQERAYVSDEDAEFFRQSAKDNIYKNLETNERYALLSLDLEHLKHKDDLKYSLTEIAKRQDEANPSYIIQSWLRDVKTLKLLCLWEKEHNPDFNYEEAERLINKSKEPSFTLTSKIWIENTNAKGLTSKQGKGGGTFAHHEIAIDFITWLFPEKRYELSKMIIARCLLLQG